jgi:hypothetical protein
MGNKNSRITSQDRAILDLKVQRDKLKQYQKKVNKTLETNNLSFIHTNYNQIGLIKASISRR